jgi:hypothetical protein
MVLISTIATSELIHNVMGSVTLEAVVVELAGGLSWV